MPTVIVVILSSILTNNIVLHQGLGMCPYVSVSKRINASFKLGLSTTFVLFISTLINFIIYRYILIPLNLEYLEIVISIIVISALVSLLELLIKKLSVNLYNILGIYLPLITTNCIVLGVTLNLIRDTTVNLFNALLTSFFTGIGFLVAILLLASIRNHVKRRGSPSKLGVGVPLALIIAGLLSLAFQVFSGMI